MATNFWRGFIAGAFLGLLGALLWYTPLQGEGEALPGEGAKRRKQKIGILHHQIRER